MESNLKDKIDFIKNKTKLIPSNWNFDYLGNVAIIKMGQSPSSSSYNEEGIGKYLIQGNADIFNRKSSPRMWTSKPTKTCEIGETLMTVRAPVGAVAKALHSACIGRGMCSINSVKINNEFLYQFLLSYENSWKRIEQGSTFTAISGNDIKKVIIPIPTRAEQEKIAKILSRWDEAIETTQNLIAQLQLRKKGLMQELLSGKKRLAGFSEEWKKMSIGDVATQFTDKNKDDENIEVLSCTKYDGLVPSLEYFGRKVYGDDLSKYKIVPRNYFAYATNHIEEGSIGYQNIWDRGLVSPMYTVFKTNDRIDDSFFFRLLKTDRMIYAYQSNMSGSIARRGGLRWNVFETLIIKIPSYKEQIAIANVFNKVDEEIDTASKHLESLKQQKKGLMQQLLTGQKRVKID